MTAMHAAEKTPTRPTRWPEIAATALGIIAACAYLWWGWCSFPLQRWNEVRLAPAFALRHGIPLYPPQGGGPLSTWIYGPVGAVLNVPATWAKSASQALLWAGALNLATLTLPLAAIIGSMRVPQGSGWSLRGAALAAAILTLPAAGLTFQVADHAAVACGLISCWLLARSRASTTAVASAAALAVMSIWAKQTSIFLPMAQLIYLRLERDRAAVYAAWLAALGAASLVAAAAVSDLGNLWLNLMAIPARLPWGDWREKIILRWPALLGQVVLPILIIALLQARGLPRRRHGDAERFLRCCIVVFAVSLPAGLLAFLKIGGDLNVLHAAAYLVPAVIVCVAANAGLSRHRGILFGAAIAGLVLLRLPQLTSLPARPLTMEIERAERIAGVRPGAVWFPFDPVVTFYSDRVLYHVEDGIATRHLAGYGIRETDFRRHLPDPLEAIVYPASETRPFALQLLREFNERTIIGHWAIYERTPGR